MLSRANRKYKDTDWTIYPWPQPPSGDPDDYGPTEMQQNLFIYHYQPWERPHFHAVDVALMIGGAGSGKSLRRNTSLLRVSGVSALVQDIKVGDKLLGPNGEIQTVLSLGRGRETFYKVIPIKGEPFECNESHILTLKKSGNDKEVRINRSGSLYKKPPRYGCKAGDVVNVTVKEYLTWTERKRKAFKLYRSGGVEFTNNFKPSPLFDPYMLGVWLGDGDSHQITVTSMDHQIVDATIEYANTHGLKYRLEDQPGKAIRVHVNGSQTTLRKLNLYRNKHIPNEYKLGSKETRLQLLAGLIDTDGSYDRGGVDFIQKDESIARDFAFICRSLGFAAYVTPCKKSCQTKYGKFTGDYFRVSVSGDLTSIPTRLPRKQAFKREQIKDVLLTGFSLERLEEDDYYGFTLDGDHLFLLEDFTVMHNSIASIAEIIELSVGFEKCAAVVGGKHMPLLRRNVIEKFGERLSWVDEDGMRHDWAHPIIDRPPSVNRPMCKFINGSTISFVNIDDPEVVRGFTGDVFLIEEVNLMEAGSLREMLRRSRGRALPIRQFILNMNPTGTRDWVYDMFSLRQFEDNYEGEPMPIGEACSCEFCHVCDAQDKGQHIWEGGEKKIGPNGRFYEWTDGTCPNPECPTLLNNIKRGKGPIPQKKQNSCPGNQHYYRVIRSASFDNPHNPSDYVKLQRGALSEEEFNNYVLGKIVEMRSGYIYKEFSDDNVRKDLKINPEKDIYWTHDFNFEPMCSFVCQETADGLNVIEELILWNKDEKDVALEFVRRYQDVIKGKVYMYGDPAGLNTSRADSGKSSYKVMYDILKGKGFDVEMGIQKVKGETIIPRKDRFNNLKAIIRNADGYCKLFVDSSCGYLLESLRYTKWGDKADFIEDDKCDDNAKTNPKRSESFVLMTHPQAALGYLVTKRFPLLKAKRGQRVMDTEHTTLVVEDDSIVETAKALPPEENKSIETNGHLNSLIQMDRGILDERLAAEKKAAEEYELKMELKIQALLLQQKVREITKK